MLELRTKSVSLDSRGKICHRKLALKFIEEHVRSGFSVQALIV